MAKRSRRRQYRAVGAPSVNAGNTERQVRDGDFGIATFSEVLVVVLMTLLYEAKCTDDKESYDIIHALVVCGIRAVYGDSPSYSPTIGRRPSQARSFGCWAMPLPYFRTGFRSSKDDWFCSHDTHAVGSTAPVSVSGGLARTQINILELHTSTSTVQQTSEHQVYIVSCSTTTIAIGRMDAWLN